MSPEWMAATAGNPGASNFSKIVTTKGERSKQRDEYMMQLAGEFITGKKEDGFQSQSMILGMEREDSARKLFELSYGVEVKQAGVVFKDDKKLYHCSPDGLIGDKAGLELKNPMMKTHVKYLLENVLPTDYFCQVQGNLFVTERDLWYFMSSYEGLPPFIIEVRRDERFIGALKFALEEFCGELESMIYCISGRIKLNYDVTLPIALLKHLDVAPGTKNPMKYAPRPCPNSPGNTYLEGACAVCKDRLVCKVWQ
jgi:hypothetical protein